MCTLPVVYRAGFGLTSDQNTNGTPVFYVILVQSKTTRQI